MLHWRESNPELEDSKPHVLHARETHSHAGNQVSFKSSPGQTLLVKLLKTEEKIRTDHVINN